VDRLKAYRISALIRKGGGANAGTAYIGLMGWNSVGTDQRGVGSPAVPYTAYSIAVTSLTTSFVRHTVTVSQATIAAMQSGVVFIGAHVILGYNAGTINGWVEMQDVRLEEVAASLTIDANAAAEVITVTAASTNNGAGFTTIATANFGPYPVATEIEVTFAGQCKTKPDPDEIGPFADTAICLAFIDGSSGTDSATLRFGPTRYTAGAGNETTTAFSVSHTFTLAADTSGSAIGKTSIVLGDTAPAPAPTKVTENAIIRATAVKR
jgi:hypothetical protein